MSAAYGASGVRRPPTLLSRARAALLRTGSSSGLAGFLRELRPGWWVLRGYALGMLTTLMLSSEARLVPATPPDWALVVLAIIASVWLGRRPRGRSVVLTAVAANALAAMALLAGFAGGERRPVAAGPDGRERAAGGRWQRPGGGQPADVRQGRHPADRRLPLRPGRQAVHHLA
ncbi:hypothetical protein [Nonomuraea salmonea]|uniref:hypothetical protein n=1 Tax=Nonomuraea salmonea TaxID=46181 RepID=UPI002FE95E5A